MKNIGLITWHYYNGFGSVLQAYALQTVIEKLGYKPELINYRNPKFSRNSVLKQRIKYVLTKTNELLKGKLGKRFSFKFLAFREENFSETRIVEDLNELSHIASKYQAIICGSDQIWAPNVFNPVYMINFVDGKKIKKISYAASLGLNYIPPELQNNYKMLLSDFNAVSVREEVGKKLLKEKCDVDSRVVLDPTLLIDKSEYQKMQKPINKIQRPYIFCFFLNKEHKYKEQVLAYAKKHGYFIVGCSDRIEDNSWMDNLKGIGPHEFIWLIENASKVFTDSYHGTIFSLLFHKEFWTFERFNTEDPINQNSRIYQLDKTFNIGERIVNNDSVLENCEKLDYDIFEEILLRKRKSSISFLKGALE